MADFSTLFGAAGGGGTSDSSTTKLGGGARFGNINFSGNGKTNNTILLVSIAAGALLLVFLLRKR